MKILIGADIVPTESNQQFFENADMDKIIDGDLYDILKKADYRMFNLEVPLTDIESPIKKCGPNLIASTKSVAGLEQLNVNFLTLANNHILDQGEQGLWSTVKQLDKAEISYAGVGYTPTEASNPHIFESHGVKVGIYCCAEHEFSIVGDQKAGANPFDPLESLDHIIALKEQCDYVICLYHGGKEHYRYPSPNLQRTCRKIVEKGADLVVCQHTHCIGCEEQWESGTIVYGQGNFLFDYSKSEFWKTSLLISADTENHQIGYIPLEKKENGVKLARGNRKNEILSEFYARSELMTRPGFIEEEYSKMAVSQISGYMRQGGYLTSTLAFRILDRVSRGHLMTWYTKQKIKQCGMALINQYECEPHRELILKGLRVILK